MSPRAFKGTEPGVEPAPQAEPDVAETPPPDVGHFYWAAMMLGADIDAYTALMRGLPVPRDRLQPEALAALGNMANGPDLVLTDDLALQLSLRMRGDANGAPGDETPGETPAVPARSWLRVAGDLLRQDDPGPTPYLVEHLLVDCAIAAVQGAGKVGKTWTILELARAIVTGEPAFGRFPVPVPGPVIVLLEESGEAALHRRLAALMRGNAQRPDDFDALFYGANLGVKLTEPRWQERLVAAVVELRPRAVFLDPLVRMKGAGVDENVQREMAVVLETILELRESAGAAPVFAHHTGHDGKHLRGSSDLEAFWESKIAVAKLDDGRREVKSEHREAEAGPKWHYRLAWDHETRSVRLRAEEDSKRQDVADYLREYPDATKTDVFKHVGGRKQDVFRLVDELRDQLGFEGLE